MIRALFQTTEEVLALSYKAWNVVVGDIGLAYRAGRKFVIGSGQSKRIRRYETFQGQGHAECTVLFEDGDTRHYTAEYR